MQYRSVTVLAPAKLNLSLDVVGTLPNGYHDLDMVMQTIDLYEKITLRRSHDLTLNLPGSFVPANDKNTAVKAALAFFAYTGLLAGVDMTIYKRVPVRAGMAGGSADAAGVLVGLNELADSYQSYRRIGVKAVPAFVFSHCLGNVLGRPDFIAWCPDERNWAVRLCAALGAMMVMWTALPEHDTEKLEKDYDGVIFQWYAPKPKYK